MQLAQSLEICLRDGEDVEGEQGLTIQFLEHGARGDIIGYVSRAAEDGLVEAQQISIATFCQGDCPPSLTG